jgi:hypothetical protein
MHDAASADRTLPQILKETLLAICTPRWMLNCGERSRNTLKDVIRI